MSGSRSGPSPRPATHAPKWFWVGTVLLLALTAALLGHDLPRPMVGLHSLGLAHDAWLARSHVVYGLGYTKGFDTFALGDPPPAQPTRYLDHPILFTLVNSLAMSLVGVHDWTLRAVNLLATLVALWLLLRIIRRLTNPATALLTGLFFCMFPVIAYFGVNMWLYPLVFFAYACYLTLIGACPDARPGRWQHVGLTAALFLAIQLSWEGFFFAAAIALHYLARCIRGRQRPDRALLAIVLGAPLASMLVNGMILAAGHGWDFGRLVALARWRMTSGEYQSMPWSQWFVRLWEHAVANFTLPVIVLIVLYLIALLLPMVARSNRNDRIADHAGARKPAAFAPPSTPAFPHFWLFLIPPLLQLFLLRGMLPAHAWWERPLAPLLAIAAALAVRGLFNWLRGVNVRVAWAGAVVALGLLMAGCLVSTSYYYGVLWQRPEMARMFERVRGLVPPSQHLLSFESYRFDQKPGVKAASIRPEIAWYLDREIDVSRDLDEIDRKAQAGEYAYYLTPVAHPRTEVAAQLARLVPTLRTRYRIVATFPEIRDEKRYLPWFPRDPQHLRTYRDGMLPHQLFDLRERVDGR